MTKKPKSVRFWGKIFGSEKDYYIAEVDGYEPEGDQGEPPADAEPRGAEGANRYTYFVANDGKFRYIQLEINLKNSSWQLGRAASHHSKANQWSQKD